MSTEEVQKRLRAEGITGRKALQAGRIVRRPCNGDAPAGGAAGAETRVR